MVKSVWIRSPRRNDHGRHKTIYDQGGREVLSLVRIVFGFLFMIQGIQKTFVFLTSRRDGQPMASLQCAGDILILRRPVNVLGRSKSCCGVGPAQAEAEQVDSAAVPLDVRKGCALPRRRLYFWGYAPRWGVAPPTNKGSRVVGQSHHRTSGGRAARGRAGTRWIQTAILKRTTIT
jgi:hypothetical protein